MTRITGQFSIFTRGNNAFSLVRLVAAALVIYGHSYAISPGSGQEDIVSFATRGATFTGELSVVVFFFLSGALISQSAEQARNLRSYFIKRIFRIYPALLVCIVVTVFILAPIFGGKNLGDIVAEPQTWNYLFRNGVEVYNEHFIPGVFDDHPNKGLNGSLWSITLEVRLYLLVGIMLALRVMRHPKMALTAYILLIAGLWLIPNSIPVVGSNPSLLGSDPFPTFGTVFLLGGVYSLIEKKLQINWALLGSLFALIAAVFAPFERNIYRFGLFGLTIALMIIFATSRPVVERFQLKSDYSYGIYLFGWPAEQAAFTILKTLGWGGQPLLITLVAIAIAASCAVLSWTLVERPMLRLASRLSGK